LPLNHSINRLVKVILKNKFVTFFQYLIILLGFLVFGKFIAQEYLDQNSSKYLESFPHSSDKYQILIIYHENKLFNVGHLFAKSISEKLFLEGYTVKLKTFSALEDNENFKYNLIVSISISIFDKIDSETLTWLEKNQVSIRAIPFVSFIIGGFNTDSAYEELRDKFDEINLRKVDTYNINLSEIESTANSRMSSAIEKFETAIQTKLERIPFKCSNNFKLVGFGDSHTYGNDKLPITYLDYIWKYINFLNTNNNFNREFNCLQKLDNESMGGSTLTSNFQSNRLLNYNYNKSDRVIMLLGFNDSGYNGSDPNKLAAFSNELDKILKKIEAVGSRVYLGTCPVLSKLAFEKLNQLPEVKTAGANHYSVEACNSYAEETRKVASKYKNVVIVDVNKKLKFPDKTLIDGTHFSFEKHKEIAELFIWYMTRF
jgi:lysophospholipase L1-like esterase